MIMNENMQEINEQSEAAENDYLMQLIEAMSYYTSQIDAIYDVQMHLKDCERVTGIPIREDMKQEVAIAIKACREANHHLYKVFDSISTEVNSRLAKYSKENVLHKYNRVRLDGMFVKQENNDAYLLEFPLAVTHGNRERYLWISKKFCTRNKDTICIRYYDNFTFQRTNYDHLTGKQISSSQMSVIEFESLMIDANLYAARMIGKDLIDYPEMVKESKTQYKTKKINFQNDYDITN